MGQIFPQETVPPKLIALSAYLPPEDRPYFRDQVNQLAFLAVELNNINNLNKEYLEEALDTVEHILGILTGKEPPSVYGRKNPQKNSGPPRLLTKEA